MSYIEFGTLTKAKEIIPITWWGSAAIIAIILNAHLQYIEMSHLLMLITIVMVIRALFEKRGSALSNVGTTILGIMYIGLSLSSLVVIRNFLPNDEENAYLIMAMLSCVWATDTGAYFFGKSFGKRKLFKRISPNKSWEGAIMGFVVSLITLAIFKATLLPHVPWIDALVIGFIIGTVGQMGDLVESMFKRDSGVKDSSGLIPGHGGIFDRFDSLIASSPIILLYLLYISKVF